MNTYPLSNRIRRSDKSYSNAMEKHPHPAPSYRSWILDHLRLQVGRRLPSTCKRKHVRSYSRARAQSTTAVIPIDFFHYAPLDVKGNWIRCVEVLSDLSTKDNLIQCRLSSTTLEDRYTCLSYVWGSDDQMVPIYLNDKMFLVRSNLWNFLDVARKEFQSQPLWIDAISINQNDDTERTRQVQQMGQIFSRARDVVVWLGNNRSIAALFDQLQVYDPDRTFLDLDKQGVSQLGRHAYWTRAWVTQELLLARRSRFLASKSQIEYDILALAVYGSNWWRTELARVRPFFSELQRITSNDTLNKTPLIQLLVIFQDKQCAVPRDRIFSLLSICSEGRRVQVSYSLPAERLLAQVIGVCWKWTCLCSILMLAKALHVLPRVNKQWDRPRFLRLRFHCFTLGSLNCGTCNMLANTIDLPNMSAKRLCLSEICRGVRGHLYDDDTSTLQFRAVTDNTVREYQNIRIIRYDKTTSIEFSFAMIMDIINAQEHVESRHVDICELNRQVQSFEQQGIDEKYTEWDGERGKEIERMIELCAFKPTKKYYL